MKNLNVKVLTEISIIAAIAFVLDYIQGAYTDLLFPTLLPNGGSIGIAMLPIMILALRRGLIPGLMCGLIVGGLDLLDGFWTYSDVWYKAFLQVSIDYVLAYTAVGLAGLMYKKTRDNNSNINLVLAVLIAGGAKYFLHIISGVFFWPNDAWGGFVMYAILYNSIYMIPSIILCAIVLVVINKKNKQIIFGEYQN